MKKILFSLWALALLLGVSSAHGAFYTWDYLAQGTNTLNGGTNRVAAATTNTYNYVLDVTRSDTVTIELGFRCGATNVNTNTFVFEKSVDRSTWYSFQSIPVVANGTNRVDVSTNYSIAGYGYMRFTTLDNANTNLASALSNLTVRVGQKQL